MDHKVIIGILIIGYILGTFNGYNIGTAATLRSIFSSLKGVKLDEDSRN